MRQALAQAKLAEALGEVPVGAVIVRGGEVIARGYNRRETDRDPTAHAEMLALREAAREIGDWRLTDCVLYVTLEPCPMCAGALAMARIGGIVFGAWDAQMGCCGSRYLIPGDAAFAVTIPMAGGVLAAECAGLLTASFARRREP